MRKIFVLYHREDDYAGEIVAAAMRRSFTSGQVERLYCGPINGRAEAAVFINPTDAELKVLNETTSSGGKALVLGKTGPRFAERLGLDIIAHQAPQAHWTVTEVDPSEPFNVSPVDIHYDARHPIGAASVINPRPLCRYDFNDEWNNQGFGVIGSCGGPWALSCLADPGEMFPVGWLQDPQGDDLSAYAAIRDYGDGSALWLNRAVGPVDSLEWRMVENTLYLRVE